jgi:hypothetical protein
MLMRLNLILKLWPYV